ncbi:MAG: FMN-binding protein [Gammaproteobacteria bacterium]|nr:FMN-binding protein [Gammaproteobacteria bacterium]
MPGAPGGRPVSFRAAPPLRIPTLAISLSLASAALCAPPAAAEVYQAPETFLEEVFGGRVPEARAVWLTGEVRATAERILGHKPRALRVRYWRRGARSAWVLEEIGKSEPITVGIAIEAGAIERIEVLVFRESRGYEVRHPFFTEQFEGATLTGEHELSRPIDGISGATLSVRALKKLARLALYLDGRVDDHHAS